MSGQFRHARRQAVTALKIKRRWHYIDMGYPRYNSSRRQVAATIVVGVPPPWAWGLWRGRWRKPVTNSWSLSTRRQKRYGRPWYTRLKNFISRSHIIIQTRVACTNGVFNDNHLKG